MVVSQLHNKTWNILINTATTLIEMKTESGNSGNIIFDSSIDAVPAGNCRPAGFG